MYSFMDSEKQVPMRGSKDIWTSEEEARLEEAVCINAFNQTRLHRAMYTCGI